MHPKARALLYDMQQADMLVERFVSGKSFDDYVADPLLRSCVERQLEIIGEALNQLAKLDPDEVAGSPTIVASSRCATSWFMAMRGSTVR